MPYRLVSFLTDYGLSDGFVAACRGVLATLCPAVPVVDITHLVPAQDVRRGAVLLAQTVPDLPPAVHLAVVDPGVGTGRRGVAVQAGASVLVGPDNGLLIWAADALGGATAAHALTEPRWQRTPVSATFHGRDVFAPVAGHLAAGVPMDAFGPAVPVDDLVRLPDPVADVRPGSVRAEVLTADRFGNLQLAVSAADLPITGFARGNRVRVTGGTTDADATVGHTFADVPAGDLVVFVDSAGRLAVARAGGSAAAALGVDVGAVLQLRAATG